MNKNLVVILGPTAVGKTNLAVNLAQKFSGEIISADSRQVYKGMDIGTGKDLSEYSDCNIPYHMIDIISPLDEFSLFDFVNNFVNIYPLIIRRKKLPFLVGGTGLYLSSILQDYKLKKVNFNSERAKFLNELNESELLDILKGNRDSFHNTTDFFNKKRIINAILISESNDPGIILPELNPIIIGVFDEREVIKKRITERLKFRLKNGMIEEVENLIEQGISHEKLDFFGLEYRYISKYLTKEINYNDLFQKLNSSIHKFAKRQMTWFRKMEKDGVKINWIKPGEIETAEKLLRDNLA